MQDVTDLASAYIRDLKKAFSKINLDDIQKISEVIHEAYLMDNTVFILGNGGSSSISSHMACDLGKGTLKNVYNQEEKRLRVISLTDNVACMTAFANDLSYDDIFVQQLHTLVRPGDIVIGISGSGNTPNVIKALIYAKSIGATTIGFLGFHTGGKAREFVDYDITIASNNYGIVEDIHTTLNHILTSCLSYMREHSGQDQIIDNGPLKKQNRKIKSYKPVEWIERSARR